MSSVWPSNLAKGKWTAAATLLGVVFVFLYLSVFVLPATTRFLEGDAYINFDNARRMVSGQTLYQDIFQYTLPGTELLEYPLIRMFGAKLAVLSSLIILVGLAETLLALSIGSSLLSRGDAILATLLFLCFGFHCGLDATHHKFSVLMVYAALAVVIPKRSSGRIAAAGLLLGLATCFTQTRGLVALAMGGFLVWENRLKPPSDQNLRRDEISLFLPFTAVVVLACAYVLWNGGLDHFWRYIIRFPLLHYREGNANSWVSSFDDWFPTFRGIAEWMLMKLLVPGTCVAFWIYWWRTSDRETARPPVESVLIAVFATSLLATVAYAPLHVRLAGISLPAMILAIWMLNKTGTEFWKAPLWLTVGGFLILAPWVAQTQHYDYYDAPAGHLAISDPALFDELNWLDRHTKPGDKFFYASGPMLYVLLDLQNPARVPFVEADDYTRPHQVEVTARRLREGKPKFILWPFDKKDADDPSDRLYLIGEELRAYYRPTIPLRDGQLWERKEDPRSN